MNCLFCRIIGGEIPSAKVYEDEFVFAFRDINPQAPTHVLIVPREHYDSVLDAPPEVIGHITEAAKLIAKAEGVDETGFRLLMNTGADAGQTVRHLHMHLIGGKELPLF